MLVEQIKETFFRSSGLCVLHQKLLLFREGENFEKKSQLTLMATD